MGCDPKSIIALDFTFVTWKAYFCKIIFILNSY